MECQWLMCVCVCWLAMTCNFFRRLNQCESADDGLALNRLALARNGCGLQVYSGKSAGHNGVWALARRQARIDWTRG